jgi:hypothetical protein
MSMRPERAPMGVKFLTPHTPPRPGDRPANRESNNGRNCWTCASEARELNRAICLDMLSGFTEPRQPSMGCPRWKPRPFDEKEPIVPCNGEVIAKPKGEDEDGDE